VTPDEFFAGREESRQILNALCSAVDAVASAGIRVTKSQSGFRQRRAFAWAWVPDRHLHGRHAPLVPTLALRRRCPSPRWNEIVEPAPGGLPIIWSCTRPQRSRTRFAPGWRKLGRLMTPLCAPSRGDCA